MDLWFFGAEIAMRLQAGAVGSLLAVLTSKQDFEASPYKRMFCGWIVAIFGAPLAVSICASFSVSAKWLDKVGRADAEMFSAFFVGLIGWRMLGLINHRTDKFVQENRE